MASDMTFRVDYNIWAEDGFFNEFLDMMTRIGTIRTFSLFTHYVHTAPCLEEMERRANLLKRRIKAMRDRGFKCGINQLDTLGHCDEDLLGARQLKGRLFMDIFGRTSLGNFCPRDPEWRQGYLIPVYTMLAKADPDFIWIDDDVRLNNHGQAHLGCFCDDCLAAVSKQLNFRGTREELMMWLDAGEPQALRQRRKKLIEWNRSVLADELKALAEAVHAVNPDILIGKMDSIDYWEAERHLQGALLRGPRNLPIWWRPGGGAYTDETPASSLAEKMRMMGRIIANIPDYAESIQSEIESFPYQNLKKSTHFVCLETSAYCAAGCTGTALNVIGDPHFSPLSTYEDRVATLAKQKAFNDRIVDMNQRIAPGGIWDGYDQDNFLGNAENAPHWASMEANDANMEATTEPLQIGLPWSYDIEHAVCAALNGRAAQALDEDKLMALFAKGVYLDADAVRILNERGLGQYVGFKTGEVFLRDTIEKTSSGRFNPEPFTRNMRQSFWGGKGVGLVPLDKTAEKLARLVDYHDNVLADCSLGCYVNSLGGRVVASGYASWKVMGYVPKYRQMHAIFNWLSNETLPAEVDEPRVWTNVHARRRPDGSLAVAVANLSLDSVEDLTVTLATEAKQVRLVRNKKEDCLLATTPIPSKPGKCSVRIPAGAFELVCLETL